MYTGYVTSILHIQTLTYNPPDTRCTRYVYMLMQYFKYNGAIKLYAYEFTIVYFYVLFVLGECPMSDGATGKV